MSGDLKNHQQKCRLCFQPIKTARSAVEISEEIQQNFLDLTNLEVRSENVEISGYSPAHVLAHCIAHLLKRCVQTLRGIFARVFKIQRKHFEEPKKTLCGN